MKKNLFKMKLLTVLVLSTLNSYVMADETVDLGTVGSQSGQTNDTNSSVSYSSPTQASLNATQPQSTINEHYIKENAAPGSNYTDIISIAPSVMSVDPNGAGGQETQNITIRGFQDGQFNVTFDGIPIGDTNDFTHHSTSFFMNQDIKNIVVDRGPGDAANIGYATFGGTVAVSTVDPSQNTAITPFGTIGSWNTRLGGVQFDTGNLQKYGDAKAYFSYKNFSTDGYLTNSGQNRQNIFLKFEKPLTDSTTVSFVATTNKVHQNVSYGATLGSIAQNGLNYGLSTDPNTQNFYGYNIDNIQTDIEYFGIKSRINEWNIDNKLYTYAYYHQGLSGGPNGGNYSEYPYFSTNGGATLSNGTTLPNDVTGQLLNNNYRSWGDILRLSKNYKSGELDTGIWIDRQSNDKTLNEVDWTQNGAYNYNVNNYGNNSLNYIDTQGNETITTIQPYLQYVYNINNKWQITPGVKYSSFNRDTNFPIINQNYPGTISNQTYSRFLKSLSTKYLMNKNWSVYGAYSEGFLAPKLQLLQTNPPTNPATINPERTENYQLGTTWKDNKTMLGVDVYKILTYDTSIAQTQGGQTVYQSVGGIQYSGIEFEGSRSLFRGLTLYGNYSINNYAVSGDAINPQKPYTGFINNTPHNTGALGLIYENNLLYTSLITKYVGGNYSNHDVNNQPIYFGGYSLTNFTFDYKLDNLISKNSSIGLQLDNLFNRTGVFTSVNADFNGNPLYYTIPERAYYINFKLGI